jgi:cell pole-organizing protein PopZ
MPRDRLAHLSDEELARYQDGERFPAEAAHVEGCAQCTARLHDLKAAIAAYAEYHDSIRSPQLPPVPAPWRRLDQLVADHESQRRRRVLQWWLPAVAAAFGLVVFIAGGLRDKEAASERASQLLERAALISMPADRMISMRIHGRTLLRPAVLIRDAGVDSDPELTHAEKLFQAAHYGWRQPLSPRTFQAWRGVQKNRTDSVSMIVPAGRERMYRVRTDVWSGVLRSASLILRAEDLRPAGGDFEFEGEGLVSMEEVPAPVTPVPASPLLAPTEPVVETPVGPAETLHVLAALDEIGADAGEPIDVTEDAAHRHVVVRAGGLSAERRQAVLTALAAVPRVTVDFQSQARPFAPPPTIPPQTYSSSIPSQFRQRFEERLGGPLALQEITDRVLEASAQNLARAHAVEVLARDFPPEAEAGMNSQDRLLLRQLRRRHLTELERLVRQIRDALKALLDTPAATPPAVGDNGRAQTWQSGVPTLVASAEETDQLLNHLLAGSYSQSSGEEMLRRLTAALGRLEWAVQSQSKVE